MQMLRIDWKRTLILFLICIVIFSILFSKIEFGKILENIKKINLIYLVVVLLISLFLNVGLASYKLQRLLLYFDCKISFKETLSMIINSGPLRFIFPFKSGELLLAGYLRATKRCSFVEGVGLVAIDKILNIISILVFIPLGLVFFQIDLWKKCIVSLGVISLLLLFFKMPLFVANTVIKRYFPKINIDLEKILHTFSFTHKFKLGLYALVFQSSEILTTYILFKALKVEIPLYIFLVFVPLTIFISSIPITIAGLGTREATFLFFYRNFGTPAQIFSTGILISFIEYIFIYLLGIFTMHLFLTKLWHTSWNEDFTNQCS